MEENAKIIVTLDDTNEELELDVLVDYYDEANNNLHYILASSDDSEEAYAFVEENGELRELTDDEMDIAEEMLSYYNEEDTEE